MDKFGTRAGSRWETIEQKWQQLPARQKHNAVLYAFTAYVILTLVVIVQVVIGLGDSTDSLKVDHIENPVVKPREVKYKNQSNTVSNDGK